MQFRRERVRIETARHEIEGTLQLPHEGFRSRMTDFLNTQGDDFLPLTDAEVTYLDGSRAPEQHDVPRARRRATWCWWSSSARSAWSTSRSRRFTASAPPPGA